MVVTKNLTSAKDLEIAAKGTNLDGFTNTVIQTFANENNRVYESGAKILTKLK